MLGLLRDTVAPLMPAIVPELFIPVASIVGILFAIFTWWRVSFIKVGSGTRTNGEEGRTFLLEEELAGEESVRVAFLEYRSWKPASSLIRQLKC